VSEPTTGGLTRRDLIKTTGQVAVASALAGVAIPAVHAAESNTIQLALVGCGGRGTGAAEDALNTTLKTRLGPTKLVAMADVFDDRLKGSYRHLSRDPYSKLVDVPEERKFVGFDGYKQAMDCLKPGDVVILATPPAFRWVHFTYAIAKGLNVFMEKPVTVDAPTSVRMLKLAEESKKKNLKCAVGLMCRHCHARGELHKRIRDGQIGDVTLLRAYRVAGPTGNANVLPNKTKMSDLMYQIRNFHGFLWASGGAFSDFLIHNIDECCWMKDAWPVEAKGYGGRQYRNGYIDQNFDVYTVEYTFADGAKLMLEGRCMEGCDYEFASYAHGTKGSAVISQSGHFPARVRTYKDQRMSHATPTWSFPVRKEEPFPYHRVERLHHGDPRRQAVQRGAARRRGQPGDVDGPHGLPHGQDHHLQADARGGPRVRPEHRQADPVLALAADARQGRQVSGPATRQGDEAGV